MVKLCHLLPTSLNFCVHGTEALSFVVTLQDTIHLKHFRAYTLTHLTKLSYRTVTYKLWAVNLLRGPFGECSALELAAACSV